MAITLHTLAPTDLPEQTELEVGRFRDEFQVQVDRDVASLKARTAKAGWPDPDPKEHFHRYVVGKDDAVALKGIIRRAGTLYKVEPEFYKNATTEAGHVVVKFHVQRKTDKEGKFVKDDTLTADGKPTPQWLASLKEDGILKS
jgi:hypothetical protein